MVKTTQIQAKERILLTYLIYAVSVLLLWVLLAYGPFWHRNLLDTSSDAAFRLNHQTPLRWYEYLQMYTDNLLPGAAFGLFALVPLVRLRQGKIGGAGFFAAAVSIGLMTLLFAVFFSALARVDCGSDCSADIPSYLAMYTMIALAAIPLVAFPLYCYIRFQGHKP